MRKNDFVIFADLPPSPFDDGLIKDYLNLGFNTILLTEDEVKMIENNHLAKGYIDAINNLSKHDVNIWIRNMYNDPDYFDNNDEDKKRSNYGTPYSLLKRHLTDEFKTFKSITGFYMADEPFLYQFKENPNYASFDQLIKLVDYYNKYYKDYFFHMNMVPSSSWDHYYNSGNNILNYQDFINSYIDIIIKRVDSNQKSICLDNYPFIGDKYIEPSYLGDLLTLANATRDYNLRVNDNQKAIFGVCIQAFDCYSALRDKHRDILIPEEISFQVLSGLCLNARLFEYFAFRSFGHDLLGIYDQNKQKRIYDIVKKGNDYAFNFFEKIKDFAWLGADFYRGYIREFSNPVHLYKDLFYKDHYLIDEIESEYDVLLGCFENEDAFSFMILNFTDPQKNHTNNINIKFKNIEEITYFDGKKQEDIKLENNLFSISLKPGKGGFISFKKIL